MHANQNNQPQQHAPYAKPLQHAKFSLSLTAFYPNS